MAKKNDYPCYNKLCGAKDRCKFYKETETIPDYFKPIKRDSCSRYEDKYGSKR